MPSPFLGPRERGPDQWERLKPESSLAGGIGLVVNKCPTLGDSVLTVAKVTNLFSSLIIKY